MENITSLYKDNTNQKYLNYLKPSQVSFLGSEYLRAVFFFKKPSWKPTKVMKGSTYHRIAFQITARLSLYTTQYSYDCDTLALL